MVLTLLIGAVALGLIVARFSCAGDPHSDISLLDLDARVPLLESATNMPEAGYYFCLKNYLFPRHVAPLPRGKSQPMTCLF